MLDLRGFYLAAYCDMQGDAEDLAVITRILTGRLKGQGFESTPRALGYLATGNQLH
jgi:hypothetical protein